MNGSAAFGLGDIKPEVALPVMR